MPTLTYRQPQSVPKATGDDADDDDRLPDGTDMDGTMVYGRYLKGVGRKKRIDMRGAGKATRGRKFVADE